MYNFIPSWYSGEYPFYFVEKTWFMKQHVIEFDDSVNQIRMFMDAGEEVSIISLAYSPGMLHYLHRENIYPIKIFSVFDRIQDIHCSRIGLMSYRDISWPEEISFVYTSFTVMAYLHGEHYATVFFSEEGNFIYINYIENGDVIRCDYYDDRGFMSSSGIYESGHEVKRVFYNEYEETVFTWYLGDMHVEMNGNNIGRFRHDFYYDIADLITEVLHRYILYECKRDDTFVIASNVIHNDVCLKATRNRKTVLSYFGDRYDMTFTDQIRQDVAQARFLVADTEFMARQLREICGEGTEVYDISPFDTRLTLGTSQRIRELKIFMPVDHLQEPYRTKALYQIIRYMETNSEVLLYLGTDGVSENEKTIRECVRAVLNQCNIMDFGIKGDELSISSENELEDDNNIKTKSRIFIDIYRTETDIIRILNDVRLIVDVSDQPSLYLQIAGISLGIPQVNYRFTRYVEHEKEGFIIENINHVTEGLEYYLNGLRHWNEALVYCIQEIARYTGGSIVSKWKQLDAGASNG